MSSGTRWVFGIGSAVLITAFVSVFGTMALFTAQPMPGVPLTAGLDGSWDTMNSEFDNRVQTRFPMGSSEDEMARELQREGFIRDDWSYFIAPGAEAKAMRREDRIICRQAAYVYWRADPYGRLMSIRGAYRVEGCI